MSYRSGSFRCLFIAVGEGLQRKALGDLACY